jgi:hypothetical protein
MEARAQKTSDSNFSLARTESKTARDGSAIPLHFKILVHDEQNIEIFRGRFCTHNRPTICAGN